METISLFEHKIKALESEINSFLKKNLFYQLDNIVEVSSKKGNKQISASYPLYIFGESYHEGEDRNFYFDNPANKVKFLESLIEKIKSNDENWFYQQKLTNEQFLEQEFIYEYVKKGTPKDVIFKWTEQNKDIFNKLPLDFKELIDNNVGWKFTDLGRNWLKENYAHVDRVQYIYNKKLSSLK